jgi:hypothetical protein
MAAAGVCVCDRTMKKTAGGAGGCLLAMIKYYEDKRRKRRIKKRKKGRKKQWRSTKNFLLFSYCHILLAEAFTAIL